MMFTARTIGLVLVSIIAGGVGALTYTGDLKFGGPADKPMPDATPHVIPAGPHVAPPTVVSVKRFEIVGDNGKAAIILTTERGKPVAIIDDNGKALSIDLAWLARKVN